MLLLECVISCSTDPGQQPYGLQEALSVGRVEDPDLQQVLVFHHIATLQSNKTMLRLAFMQHFSTRSEQCNSVCECATAAIGVLTKTLKRFSSSLFTTTL